MQKAAEIDERLQISKKATELFDFAKVKATRLVDETNKEIAAQQVQNQQAQPQPQPGPNPDAAQTPTQSPAETTAQTPVQPQATPQQPQPGNLYPSLQ